MNQIVLFVNQYENENLQSLDFCDRLFFGLFVELDFFPLVKQDDFQYFKLLKWKLL